MLELKIHDRRLSSARLPIKSLGNCSTLKDTPRSNVECLDTNALCEWPPVIETVSQPYSTTQTWKMERGQTNQSPLSSDHREGQAVSFPV